MLALVVAVELGFTVLAIAEEEAFELEVACAAEDAWLTVTVFVKVVVVILVDVAGTQLVVALRSAPRCPELDYKTGR